MARRRKPPAGPASPSGPPASRPGPPTIPMTPPGPCGEHPEGTVHCGFSIIVDTREQAPYTFAGLRANADRGGKPLWVPTIRKGLTHGDYAVAGLPRFAIERKSIADLFGSVSRRENFIGRLERWSAHLDLAVVVVEGERSEILSGPPPFCRYPVKSLMRSIHHWTVRYPTVHWEFWPGRRKAEAATFRLLEAYWSRHRTEAT
jgi:hypothetical protein